MDPSLCSNCNLFFGNQEGLCSKCFKESRLKKDTLQTVSEILNTAPTILEEAKHVPQSSPDRCATCNKRLGNINFRCKCSQYFCTNHRLPEEHKCTYDHRTVGIRKLSEENPVIQAQKFNKL
ncbi:hypothetical protein SteCoe_29674 [Stentor coeruleus]|uniref:AN1-type domain-containing protein n=1 Tax=Stentor coeruleus TaxID=5963 RepID=A0A1R2B5G6_9CILI|nr:hypothetical protein SteCoe_29674 [Stentor coeruleus]